ncbi:putative NTE family protein [Pontiella desulfatans]|uniref:Putative NTE family protein n=2 Tax=Pontiella desulfatans TaxID=2750659 RepID=A0A6C2UAN1_PONDE|nr:putative NTE family protein [Pontiella desulfatans]
MVSFQATGNENRSDERPKIGLVLGGGGALGMSHIGVLRVLEEQRVPIDYICGTSMGAIIAGLYASGMSPDEIEAFLSGLDWNQVMSDATPRRELYFRRKLEDQRYLIEMGLGRKGLKMGAGMAAGQKFNNLLQLQVQRAATITEFDHLSIPYRAVATDLQSGSAHVIGHGNLARAMRASMAVPGAFTPVEIEGRLLVDGGIVNNLPVDVAKAMGAEFIIAVDVGSASDDVDPEELKGITGILGRTYAIMQRPEQIKQFEQADLGLQPELADFTASQFARVLELVPKGEVAARGKLDEIAKLSVDKEEYAAYLKRHRRANPTGVQLDAIEVAGQSRVSEKSIRGRIQSKAGTSFDAQTLQLDLMRIYGIGEFEQVLFHLDQKDEETGSLNYVVTEDPRGPLYLNVGLNLRSDFQNDTDWNILLNLTRRSIGPLGAEWRNDAIIGSTQGLLSEFYQPLGHGGYLFVAPMINYRSELQDLYDDKDHIAEYNVEKTEANFDFGIQLRRFAELRVGPVWGIGKGEVETGLTGLPDFDDHYAGPAFSLIVDQKDRTYFPRQGYYFETRGFFPREDWGGDVSFDKVSADFILSHSINDHTMEMALEGGSSLGTDIPGYAQFTLGGADGFSGLAQDQFRGSSLGVATLAYRYRLKELPAQLGRGIYTLSRFDVGNVWENGMNSDVRYGGSLGVGVDLNIGPLMLTYGLADGGYHSIYFSLGSEF